MYRPIAVLSRLPRSTIHPRALIPGYHLEVPRVVLEGIPNHRARVVPCEAELIHRVLKEIHVLVRRVLVLVDAHGLRARVGVARARPEVAAGGDGADGVDAAAAPGVQAVNGEWAVVFNVAED